MRALTSTLLSYLNNWIEKHRKLKIINVLNIEQWTLAWDLGEGEGLGRELSSPFALGDIGLP